MDDKFTVEHGTTKGHGQHLRAKTRPCLPCLDAHGLDMRLSRIRRGKVKALNIPLAVIAAVLAGDTDALAKELGPDVAGAVIEKVTGSTERATPTEDEMDAVYVEAIGSINLADEQWDRERALSDTDN